MKSANKQGFVSTARHTIITEIKNATTLGIWTKLKAAANFHTTTTRLNREIVLLNRGAVVFSIKQMSEELGMTRNTLRKHLGWLVLRKLIRLQTSREGSIAWLLNYDDVPIRQAVKTEMTRRGKQPCLKSSHPVRRVLREPQARNIDLANTARVPNDLVTREYLATRFSGTTDKMPDEARALLRKFKGEINAR